ncbi:MAG: hypothetical protein FIA97_07030 [Methylococcaceae bacterium]|nr:hypothetical protein [Methylococcaceae bacterium]
MELETLYALRSPVGLPSHPIVFLVLLVLTWALHILAVYVMLGSTALALCGSVLAGGHWRRLSAAMLETAKVAVSIAIVLGVAPLLFVQVIYDPFWYVSNVLSARWAIGFIGLLLAAYWLLYYRYFRNGRETASHLTLATVLGLFLLCGFIMHGLSSEMLRPELWMRWYAPGGHIDPSGSALHDYNPWRFLYFVGLMVPVTGAWLVGYRGYLERCGERDTAYLDWVTALGKRCMSAGGLFSLLIYVSWMSTLPASAGGFAASAGSLIAVVATLALAAGPLVCRAGSGYYRPMLAAGVAILLIAASREALRLKILGGGFGYDILTYPVHFDTYSTLLFFITFAVLGGSTVAFSIALSWEAGKAQGIYTASPRIARLGNASLVALAVWLAQYFLFGFLTMIG